MLDFVARWVGCISLGLGIVGCSSDFGPPDSPVGDGTDATSDDDRSTTTGTPPPGDNDESESAGDDTDGDGPDAGAEGSCDDILDCGAGWCILDEEDRPVCHCDAGYASTGYGCIPCDSVGETGDLDLPLIVIAGKITINGSIPPKNLYEYGDLYLRNPITGDEVFLGSTYHGEYHATVLPGTYDLVFVRRAGKDWVPSNEAGFLGRWVIDNEGPFDIDIPTTTVEGSVLFAGVKPPQNSYEYGRIVLRNRLTDDVVPLTETYDNHFVVNVIPGDYTVHYQKGQAKQVAPLNADVQLTDVEVPRLAETVHTIDVDIPIVRIQGAVTLADAQPPQNSYEYGRIILVDRRSGAETEIAETFKPAFNVPLVPGHYDIVYARGAGGNVVPFNNRAILKENVQLGADQTVDVDIPVVDFSGTVALENDEPPPTSASDDGVLRLYDRRTGDAILLGHTRHGDFSRRVIPGAYELRYGQAAAGAMMPANLDASLLEVHIEDTDEAIEIVVPAIDVSGEITIGGATPPSSEYSDGRIYLRNLDTGDSVLLGNTRTGSFAARVVPGTYDVFYVVETTGDGVPLDGDAWLMTVDVATEPSFDIDVPLVRLSGAIKLDDGSTPNDAENYGVLFLQHVTSNDRIDIGDTRYGGYATRLTTGRYLAGYRVVASAGVVPQNSSGLFQCLDLER